MIPWARLKTRPVMTSQLPHSSAAARLPSVRGARPRNQMRPAPRMSAAGISQLTWPPKVSLNIRSRPVGPHPLPPPTLPVSLPVSRPKPL